MKRKIALILFIILVLGGITGCGKTNSTGTGKGRILFSLSDSKDNFLSTLAAGAMDYAKANGIDLTIADAENNIEKQTEQVKTAKANGYDAIICNLVNTDTALQLITSSEGLPIIFINRSPDKELLEPNRYIYVGSDDKVSGGLQAEYIAKNIGGKTSINAVLLKGDPTQPAAVLRSESVKDGLKKAGIEVNYIFEDTAVWSREKADQMFQVFLNLKREFDVVICNNDEMALGVINACKKMGMDPSEFPIVGVDATKDGCSAVADGTMAFTVYQSASGQGKGAVEAAVALGTGKDISSIEYASDDGLYLWIPFEAVDSSNVKTYQSK